MDLFAELEELERRMGWFRRVALHVHSPASREWGRDSTDPRDRRDQLRAYPKPYLQCLDGRYDLVAITDHMQASFACDQCGKPDRCVVLPGMELTTRFPPPFSPMRVHFLAIFPEHFGPDQIDRVLHDTNIPGSRERKGDEVLEIDNVKELVTRVRRQGGILIAAHVDGDAGYRAFFRETGHGVLSLVCDEKEFDERARELCDQFKKHLLQAGVNAVEIHRPEDAKHYRFNLGDTAVEVATVLRNDARSLAALASGSFSYMKMAELSLQGLRQALAFPDTRIRHTAPTEAPAYLEGIRIAGSEGHFQDTTVAFSPSLTCIIGPRGSGKSAIVDTLRYVFGYNRGMGDEIGFETAEQIRGRQEANLRRADIELVYRSPAGNRYVLQAQYDAKDDYVTSVRDERDQDTGIQDAEKHGDLPCRLYGWGEIEKLGREPGRQRILVDRMLNLHGVVAERDRVRESLRAQRGQLEVLADRLDILYEQSSDLQHLAEFEQQFKLLRSEEVDRLFGRLERADGALTAAQRWESTVSAWLDELRKAVKAPPVALAGTALREWRALRGVGKLAAVRAAAAKLISAAEEVSQAAVDVRKRCERSRKAAQAELDKKLAQLRGETDLAAAARKRKQIGGDLTRARAQKATYEEGLQALQNELQQRKDLVLRLREVARSITQKRRAGIRRVTDLLKTMPGPRIAVSFTAAADTEMYESWLDATLKDAKVEAYRRRRIVPSLKSHLGPQTTVQAMLAGSIEAPDLTEGDNLKLREVFFPFYKDDASGVTRVHSDSLGNGLAGDECIADDVVQVTLKGDPIAKLSPGQLCSALLPVILLGSNDPLVLDQPEDNLDNKLITDLLIGALHERKQERQIIVVTHNPNIVVNGDAEQVIVMDSPDGACAQRRQGSIDDEGIMQDIISFMEGGRDALRQRFKRYCPGRPLPEFLQEA